jgi:hypothetical protein
VRDGSACHASADVKKSVVAHARKDFAAGDNIYYN